MISMLNLLLVVVVVLVLVLFSTRKDEQQRGVGGFLGLFCLDCTYISVS